MNPTVPCTRCRTRVRTAEATLSVRAYQAVLCHHCREQERLRLFGPPLCVRLWEVMEEGRG
jgi:hypothetical protein